MRCDENADTFASIIQEAARKYKIPDSFVEKDYWVISLLKVVLAIHPDLTFKGETSLSKCHHAINRFSEDIDVSLQKPHYSEGVRRKIVHAMKDSIPLLGMQLENPDQIRSRRVFNRFICDYPSVTLDRLVGKAVILELANQTPCFPVETKTVQTFIGEYLASIGRADLVQEYGLEPFAVTVQKLERTFVDKVFALCDYHISKKLDRQSRHLYDLYKIYPLIKKDESLLTLFSEIKEYRTPLPTCYSVQEGRILSVLLKEAIVEATFKDDYETKTYPLLYDFVPYEESIRALGDIANFLGENGW